MKTAADINIEAAFANVEAAIKCLYKVNIECCDGYDNLATERTRKLDEVMIDLIRLKRQFD